MKIEELVGSGDKIMLPVMPLLVIGIILNILFPKIFSVGGPASALKIISIIILATGVIIWVWSVILILMNVPKGKLITSGPFAIVKHPIYTGVALLVLPTVGFLLNTWLGLAVGIVMYLISRKYSVLEEKKLSKDFGKAWTAYIRKVKLPWL